MTTAADLRDALEPAREQRAAELLTALAEAIDAGEDVEMEPLERDAAGRVARSGLLTLPRRRDLAAGQGAALRARRIAAAAPPDFPGLALQFPKGPPVQVAPFRWSDAELRCAGAGDPPDWGPLRLWFLEWALPRRIAESPDLLGAVHALEGPVDTPRGWRFRVDLGSAPMEAALRLGEALALCGLASASIAAPAG